MEKMLKFFNFTKKLNQKIVGAIIKSKRSNQNVREYSRELNGVTLIGSLIPKYLIGL